MATSKSRRGPTRPGSPGARPRAGGQGPGRKHAKMGASPFVFLRGTYWRWAETILEVCPDLAGAAARARRRRHPPRELRHLARRRRPAGVGRQRLRRGGRMPYALDLVRLATSALLAPDGARSKRRSEGCRGGDLLGRSGGLRARARRAAGDRPRPRLGLAARDAGRVGQAAREVLEQDRGHRARAGAGALSPRARRSDAGAGPRHAHRAPRGGHRQPRVGRAGSAWPIGEARRSCARLKVVLPSGWQRARGRSGARHPLRRDRRRTLPRQRPVVPRSRATCSCAGSRPTTARSRPTTRASRCSRTTCCMPWDSSSPTCIWAPAIAATPSCATSPRRKDDWLRTNAKQAAAAVTRDYRDWKALA